MNLRSLPLLGVTWLASAAAALAVLPSSFTAVEVTTSGFATATASENANVAGYASTSNTLASSATLWTSAGRINLHPSFLDTTPGVTGRSLIADMAQGVQVGFAAGAASSNRSLPVLWRGSALSATALAIPFTYYGGEAAATDGLQAVGYATEIRGEDTANLIMHALVWNVSTGAVTDLADGGARAYGVGGGKQVGYVIKTYSNAALWSGTRASLVNLHPKGAVLSVASDTDGVRQVGYAGYDVRVRVEATKGAKTVRFNYATVWSGSAATAVTIHPSPVNAPVGVTYSQSYALAVRGSTIVGYATDTTKNGSPAIYRAILWDADFQSVDLNQYLPAGYIGAQALNIDADGIVSGVAYHSNGERHAVLWIPSL